MNSYEEKWKIGEKVLTNLNMIIHHRKNIGFYDFSYKKYQTIFSCIKKAVKELLKVLLSYQKNLKINFIWKEINLKEARNFIF